MVDIATVLIAVGVLVLLYVAIVLPLTEPWQ